MKNEKKSRRSKIKYPNLIKKYNSRIKQEYLDQDYLDKLSPAELEWLDSFMRNYNSAGFKDDGSDVDDSPEARKETYDRNNARNRCLYGNYRNKPDRYNNQVLISFDAALEKNSDRFEGVLLRETDMLKTESALVELIEERELAEIMREYAAAMRGFTEPTS